MAIFTVEVWIIFLSKTGFTKTRNGENIMLLPVEMPGWLTLKAAHFWKQFYAA